MKGNKKAKKLIRFAIILSLTLSTLWPCSSGNKEIERLTIQRLKNREIVSSVQPIPDSKTHRCEVKGLIYAPIEKVWDVISNYNSYDKFMPRTPKAFLVHPKILTLWQNQNIKNWNKFEKLLVQYKIEACGDNPFYFYNRFRMPWPLQDRYFILKTERFPQIYKSQWVEIIGNTQVNEGSWELRSFENEPETTLAVYTLYVDPGIALPGAILKAGMKGIPVIIHSLRQRVEYTLQNEKSYDKE